MCNARKTRAPNASTNVVPVLFVCALFLLFVFICRMPSTARFHSLSLVNAMRSALHSVRVTTHLWNINIHIHKCAFVMVNIYAINRINDYTTSLSFQIKFTTTELIVLPWAMDNMKRCVAAHWSVRCDGNELNKLKNDFCLSKFFAFQHSASASSNCSVTVHILYDSFTLCRISNWMYKKCTNFVRGSSLEIIKFNGMNICQTLIFALGSTDQQTKINLKRSHSVQVNWLRLFNFSPFFSIDKSFFFFSFDVFFCHW